MIFQVVKGKAAGQSEAIWYNKVQVIGTALRSLFFCLIHGGGGRMAEVFIAGNFKLITTEIQSEQEAFREDVLTGLTASEKHLSCRFFYDSRGSELFEAICDLPEYYLTRSESEILETHADDIVSAASEDVSLVELGSGSATKTRLLIEALLKRQGQLQYIPVDVSRTALEESSRDLAGKYSGLSVLGVSAEYQEGLGIAQAKITGPRFILWLGSSIGNLDREAAVVFLGDIQKTMTVQDQLLVGIDLRKDRDILEAAYDDNQGVTADFNLNLLRRINLELGGQFDLESFEHQALYDETLGRVEMHLLSKVNQKVVLADLDKTIAFGAGELIHTENSYKYSREEIELLFAKAGLELKRQWFDEEARFSLNLASK